MQLGRRISSENWTRASYTQCGLHTRGASREVCCLSRLWQSWIPIHRIAVYSIQKAKLRLAIVLEIFKTVRQFLRHRGQKARRDELDAAVLYADPGVDHHSILPLYPKAMI
jgi:hypothetical protein